MNPPNENSSSASEPLETDEPVSFSFDETIDRIIDGLDDPAPAKGLSETRPQLRRKRSRTPEADGVLTATKKILAGEAGQITVRHLFYRLVGLEVIEKEEAAYKGLCRHLSRWRRQEEIPWAAFADNTRWHIKGRTFDSVEDALSNTAETYRRNLWQTQEHFVEIWVEKDSIASIVAQTANSFGVPVFVCRGFASLSSLYSAANTFKEAAANGKSPVIYHLGDHDPSGVAAAQSVDRAFRDDFKVDVLFTRVAVTEDQIESLHLPTRPVKMSDTRAGKWSGGECVELDSMPPTEIRKLVETCIVQNINVHEWQMIQKIEAMERETLLSIAQVNQIDL